MKYHYTLIFGLVGFSPVFFACGTNTGEPALGARRVVSALEQANGLELNGTHLNGTHLNGTHLNGTHLNGTHLNGTHLNGTDLVGTTDDNLEIKASDFVSAMNGNLTLTGELSDTSLVSLKINQVFTETNGSLSYEVLYFDGSTWANICYTGPGSRAYPLNGRWDYLSGDFIADNTQFTLACRTAALGKCVDWGYPEDAQPGHPEFPYLHQACTRLVRADYCGDGVSHTKNGTPIDVWDNFGLQATANTDMPLEAEFSPSGATCIKHVRWAIDAFGVDTMAYINARPACAAKLAAATDTSCGGVTSPFLSVTASTLSSTSPLLRVASYINL